MVTGNGELTVLLSDDGAGIDWKDLLAKAEEKGFGEKLKELGIDESNAFKYFFSTGFPLLILSAKPRGVGSVWPLLRRSPPAFR